jgi:hypothetical protein
VDIKISRQQDILRKKLYYVSTAAFLGLFLFLTWLAAGPAQANGDIAGGGSTLTGFTANGFTTITFNYTGSVPFTTDIYLSYNGVSQDVLLDSITITELDGSQDFTLGATIDLVNNTNEVDVDYYLLAVGPSNSVLFQGVYHQTGHAVFVHGTDSADTITASGSSVNNVAVNYNGVTNHNLGKGLRIRAHGGDDTVTMSGITFSSTSVKPLVAGGPGTDGLTGGNLMDTFLGGAGNDAIHGGNAANTASYLDSPADVTVDLPTDTASDGWGDTDTFIKIGNAIGSEFDDNLNGDEGNNIFGGAGGSDALNGADGNDRLLGGAGNDDLNGGNGQDTAAYPDSPAGVNADIPSTLASDGYGNTDSLLSIERLAGSLFNDTLTGDGGPNIINGDNGHDIITGGGDADILQGQRGNDTIYANTAACTDDGAIDQLNGGPNTDTAFYTFSQDLPTAIENANDCP